jgi:hypothetical protein
VSFRTRQINLQFQNPNEEVVNLEGLRCSAIISTAGGYSSAAQLQIRIYGMTLEHMNQFSSVGANFVNIQNTTITVSAGNQGDPSLSQVFKGSLISSFIDTASLPDVAFVCAAVSAYNYKATPSTSQKFPGANNAETIIAGLAKSIGFGFYNWKNQTHAVLVDQVVSGSVVDQMQQIANHARFPMVIENETVIIFPNNGFRDDRLVEVSPTTGMVGYPSYWEAGFNVKCEFNPDLLNGRQVKLTSSIPKANGILPVQVSTHELSTLTPDGSWFTTIKLCPPPYVSPN